MLSRVISFFKRLWSSRFVQITTSIVGTLIIYNIIAGLIGNSAYAGTPPLWLTTYTEELEKFVGSNLFIIVSSTALISLSAFFYVWFRYRNLKIAYSVTENLANADSSTIRLLSSVFSGYDTKSKEEFQKRIKRLLYELLRDSTKIVCGTKTGRAAICFPDDQYLRVIVSHHLTIQSVKRSRFYIGQDAEKESERGTVGFSFMGQNICKCRIAHKNGFLDPDNENFINFDESRAHLPYMSLINVPIIGLSKDGQDVCLGVLIFDSRKHDAFDAPRIELLVQQIAIRVGAILSIYMEMVRTHYQSEVYFDKNE